MSITPDEKKQALETLKRLKDQVDLAIDYVQADLPWHPLNHPQTRETPNRFYIGDFCVTDRSVEPRF